MKTIDLLSRHIGLFMLREPFTYHEPSNDITTEYHGFFPMGTLDGDRYDYRILVIKMRGYTPVPLLTVNRGDCFYEVLNELDNATCEGWLGNYVWRHIRDKPHLMDEPYKQVLETLLMAATRTHTILMSGHSQLRRVVGAVICGRGKCNHISDESLYCQRIAPDELHYDYFIVPHDDKPPEIINHSGTYNELTGVPNNA